MASASEQPIDTNTAAGKCFLDMLGVGVQWDETKPIGLGQKAPLTPEY